MSLLDILCYYYHILCGPVLLQPPSRLECTTRKPYTQGKRKAGGARDTAQSRPLTGCRHAKRGSQRGPSQACTERSKARRRRRGGRGEGQDESSANTTPSTGHPRLKRYRNTHIAGLVRQAAACAVPRTGREASGKNYGQRQQRARDGCRGLCNAKDKVLWVSDSRGAWEWPRARLREGAAGGEVAVMRAESFGKQPSRPRRALRRPRHTHQTHN